MIRDSLSLVRLSSREFLPLVNDSLPKNSNENVYKKVFINAPEANPKQFDILCLSNSITDHRDNPRTPDSCGTMPHTMSRMPHTLLCTNETN